jgi:hypothetical protein
MGGNNSPHSFFHPNFMMIYLSSSLFAHYTEGGGEVKIWATGATPKHSLYTIYIHTSLGRFLTHKKPGRTNYLFFYLTFFSASHPLSFSILLLSSYLSRFLYSTFLYTCVVRLSPRHYFLKHK